LKPFTSRVSYANHKNVHTDKFKCQEKCQLGFESTYTLKKHDCERSLRRRVSYNPDAITFDCPECGLKLASKRNLMKHQVKHTNKFSCQTCQRSFTSDKDLHHHLTKPDNCKRAFSQEGVTVPKDILFTEKFNSDETNSSDISILSDYEDVSLVDVSLENQINDSVSNLSSHKDLSSTSEASILTNDDGYTSPLDEISILTSDEVSTPAPFEVSSMSDEVSTAMPEGVSIPDANELSNSTSSEDSFLTSNEVPCPTSEESFSTSNDVSSDILEKLPSQISEVSPYMEKMDVEQDQSTDEDRSNSSIGEDVGNNACQEKVVEDKATFKCLEEGCLKSFNSKTTLGSHKNIHTDKFRCKEKCKLGFENQRSLIRHDCERILKRRTLGKDPERPVINCETCSKPFASILSLKNHRYLHTDRYACNHCKQRFSASVNLNQHLKDPSRCQKYLQSKGDKSSDKEVAEHINDQDKIKGNEMDEDFEKASDEDAKNNETLNTIEDEEMDEDCEKASDERCEKASDEDFEKASDEDAHNNETQDDIEDEEMDEDFDLLSCEICEKFFVNENNLLSHKQQCSKS